MAESYFQHAEHYFRILNAMNQAAQQGQPNGQQQAGPRRPYGNEEGAQPPGEADDAEEVGRQAPAISRRPARSRSPRRRPRA